MCERAKTRRMTSKVYMQALTHYLANGRTPPDLVRDLDDYARAGVALITPEMFLLARPVAKSMPTDIICDTALTSKDPDMWYIHLLIGRDAFSKLFDIMPFALPFAGWRRGDGILRIYDLPRLQERFQYGPIWKNQDADGLKADRAHAV